MNLRRLITLRETDHRHPADVEGMRADARDEVTALRDEIRRLKEENERLREHYYHGYPAMAHSSR